MNLEEQLLECRSKVAAMAVELKEARAEANQERINAEEWYLKAQGAEAELEASEARYIGWRQTAMDDKADLTTCKARVEKLEDELEQAALWLESENIDADRFHKVLAQTQEEEK